jgi:hypothetical protein
MIQNARIGRFMIRGICSPTSPSHPMWRIQPPRLSRQNGIYMTASAYNSSLAPPPPRAPSHTLFGSPRALQMCSFSTWLAVYNRLCTSDRLATLLARYASASLRLHGISSSNAATRSGSGLMPLSCPSLMQSMGSSRPTVCEYWQSITKALLKSSFGL